MTNIIKKIKGQRNDPIDNESKCDNSFNLSSGNLKIPVVNISLRVVKEQKTTTVSGLT